MARVKGIDLTKFLVFIKGSKCPDCGGKGGYHGTMGLWTNCFRCRGTGLKKLEEE